MTEKKCGKKAFARFKWGGIGDESHACEEHTTQLRNLCEHMGWQQIFVALPDDTDKTCTSNAEE